VGRPMGWGGGVRGKNVSHLYANRLYTGSHRLLRNHIKLIGFFVLFTKNLYSRLPKVNM